MYELKVTYMSGETWGHSFNFVLEKDGEKIVERIFSTVYSQIAQSILNILRKYEVHERVYAYIIPEEEIPEFFKRLEKKTIYFLSLQYTFSPALRLLDTIFDLSYYYNPELTNRLLEKLVKEMSRRELFKILMNLCEYSGMTYAYIYRIGKIIYIITNDGEECVRIIIDLTKPKVSTRGFVTIEKILEGERRAIYAFITPEEFVSEMMLVEIISP